MLFLADTAITFAPARAEWRETVLHAFSGVPGDGRYPLAKATIAADGRLYTVTLNGGPSDNGTVVELVPPASKTGRWTERVLHAFGADPDGSAPFAGVVVDRAGAVFGTTYQGGGAGNAGTVFRLTPPATPGGVWRETILHAFKGPDGANPAGNLIVDAHGALYGTTETGGDHPSAFKMPIAWRLSPPAGGPDAPGSWTFEVLHRFNQKEGWRLVSGLTPGRGGSLFGVASSGGKADLGTVYRLDPPARAGGSWAERTLLEFDGANGNDPEAELTVDDAGRLFGTTQYGGSRNLGTVFAVTPPAAPGASWTEQVLLNFTGANGAESRGSLLLLKPDAYGRRSLVGNTTTAGTGKPEPAGNVFRLDPPATAGGAWKQVVLHSFTGGAGVAGGGYLLGGVIMDAAGALYGTAYDGDRYNDGTVWRLTP